MNLLHHQFHVDAVPKCFYARNSNEVEDYARRLGGGDVVVKAQVLGGGRGRGHFKENGFQGGVHIASSPSEARIVAEQMLNKSLVTRQTGLSGRMCKGVLLCEKLPIVAEKYFAIMLDRGLGGPVMVMSKHGGMSIEEVAIEHPDAVTKIPIDVTTGLTTRQAEEAVEHLGFNGDPSAMATLKGLYRTFVGADCT
ncbi:conserved hypothetical protein, partial [Perkinsus marinus ATCC 50983]